MKHLADAHTSGEAAQAISSRCQPAVTVPDKNESREMATAPVYFAVAATRLV